MRLFINLQYSFESYGRSISLAKAIREQLQCFSLNIWGHLVSLQPMIFLRKCVVFQKCACARKLHGPAKRYLRNNRISWNISQESAFKQKNELHNRNLHISGILNEAKVDIEDEKVDIKSKKVDIESILTTRGSSFAVKTTAHIHSLFEKIGFDEVFGKKCSYGASWAEKLRDFKTSFKFSSGRYYWTSIRSRKREI